MLSLQIQYYLFFSIACFCIIQLTTTFKDYRGLLLLKNKPLSYVFNTILLIASFIWFFSYEYRNVKGLEGSQQFYMFLPSGATGVLLTLVLSLITKVNTKIKKNESDSSIHIRTTGMDLLRNMTYIEALKESFKKGKKS